MNDEFYQIVDESIRHLLNKAGNYLAGGVGATTSQNIGCAVEVFVKLADVLFIMTRAKNLIGDKDMEAIMKNTVLSECDKLHNPEGTYLNQ